MAQTQMGGSKWVDYKRAEIDQSDIRFKTGAAFEGW